MLNVHEKLRILDSFIEFLTSETDSDFQDLISELKHFQKLNY